jgi:hypothetical protein
MFAVADTLGIVLKAALERSRTDVAVLRNIAAEYYWHHKALEAVVKQKLAARHIVVAMSPAGDKTAVGTHTDPSGCPGCPHNPSAGYYPCWYVFSKLVVQFVTVWILAILNSEIFDCNPRYQSSELRKLRRANWTKWLRSLLRRDIGTLRDNTKIPTPYGSCIS